MFSSFSLQTPITDVCRNFFIPFIINNLVIEYNLVTDFRIRKKFSSF